MKKLVAQSLLGFAAIVAMVIWKNDPTITLIVLVAIAVAMNQLSNWKHLPVFGIAMIAGTIGEYITTHNGVWSYAQQQVAGLPLFIPVMWGICAIFFVVLADYFRSLNGSTG